ncbi:Kazal-type serine protease inhibitor domain-containing protein [Rhizobium sp. Root1220]|uniref:Kazal-type serine protease inhibitor domain-containing protein n=1 Tax=Rhizobium sp. Root1220 TaxID=1736432 RepID=UPI00138F526F|nr:Kazal-type serine protease inhibitor domain-containing protein [Rhizobium sp. Root1220]
MMRFESLVQLRKLALLLVPLLSACTVDVDPGYSRPPPNPRPPQPQMCTMEYAPVCGQRGGRVQTFGNACQARSNGFHIIGRGECRAEPPVTPRPPRPEPSRPEPDRPGGVCTREYRPVCGQRGPQIRTFPNACEAHNDGFRVIGEGECHR